MTVRNRKAPDKMPQARQSKSIAPSAGTERKSARGNSSATPPDVGTPHGEGDGMDPRPRKTRDHLLAQHRSRDYWQGTYGTGAERSTRGGVAWL